MVISVWVVLVKLLIDNWIVINNQLKWICGGKILFMYLLGYVLVQVVKKFLNMNWYYIEVDGKFIVVMLVYINFGLVIDL